MVLQAKKISKSVYWVGAIDWDLRMFHGYATDRGTTYNAFLIVGESNILIDTVKKSFYSEMKERIVSVLGDIGKIDYFISLHAEMDHSGAIPMLIADAKPKEFYCSKKGVEALKAHFHDTVGMEMKAIKPLEPLKLGDKDLTFVLTTMLHWPDSMMAFYGEDGILFSQDGFGMHLASTERFDYQVSKWLLEYEAKKYYANILLPFSKFVVKLANQLLKLNLPVKLICPDHGPIWRDYIPFILEKYVMWASQDPTNKAVILYDSMWESTKVMSKYICQGLVDSGVRARCIDASGTHRSNFMTKLLGSSALIVGSPTLNSGIFPSIAEALSYIKGLKPQNIIGNAFGSYGWSGEATKILTEMLKEMKVEIVGNPVKVNYVPNPEDLEKCQELGRTIGAEVMKRFKNVEKAIPSLVTVDDCALNQAPLFLLTYGLYLISSRTESGDKINGQISTDAFQVTDTPSQVVVCLNKSELTHDYIMESGVCAVSIFDRKMPFKTIGLFGFQSGRDVDKFAQVEYKLTPKTGCPYVVENNISYVDLAVIDRHSVGTHTLFVCKVVDCHIIKIGNEIPMTYQYYQQDLRGKSPPNAPTFHKTEEQKREMVEKVGAESTEEKEKPTEQKEEDVNKVFKGKYVCGMCGFVYDPVIGDEDSGIKPGTAFEDIPDGWSCPICGVSKGDFKKLYE